MATKSILLSIKPEWVAKILNGEKTIEIRKKFPKDYVGWVYIYCTKKCNITQDNKGEYVTEDKNCRINPRFSIHGYVVARFWCDKVEEIYWQPNFDLADDSYYTRTLADIELEKKICLKAKDFIKYLGCQNGYAIHISKLEVFERPKELTEFNRYGNYPCREGLAFERMDRTLTTAPQNYCYIEGDI